jgi:predicted glycoside hydrolase/deacetylase ChbG (UPF0249 family)
MMKETKYLIVNADDYGRTPGVSRGIREAHSRGIITSTTVMMNMPGVEAELARALKESPKLGLGLHLVLTSGSPLLPTAKVSSITAGKNRFPSNDEFTAFLGRIDADEAAAEWETQIQKFIRTVGRNPDHLDSHHHSSYLTEKLFERMLNLAQKYQCPIRSIREGQSGAYGGVSKELSDSIGKFYPGMIRRFPTRMPDYFISSFYDETATVEQLMKILEGIEAGVSELMCHPGYADAALIEGSAYNRPRERELAILTSAPIRRTVQDNRIQLINFGDLKRMQNN